MSNEDLKKQFVELRLKGMYLPKIAESLGISLVTAKRWNKIFNTPLPSEDNNDLQILRSKIIDKYKEYYEYLDTQFGKIKKETEKYESVKMPYDKLLASSMKILNAINRMNIMKPSYGENQNDTSNDTSGIINEVSHNQELNPENKPK
jgi:hypothetical protein